MHDKLKIALIGKSGAGKSAVAQYLASKYSFEVCNTGKKCRDIANEFFNNESKEILQKITDAFNAIEKGVWLKVALKEITIYNTNIVIDSLRFIEDYNFAKSHGFKIWKIESPQVLRASRLIKRGQEYKIENDTHKSETELQNIIPDFTIDNSLEELEKLYSIIDLQLNV